MTISIGQLQRIMPFAKQRADGFLDALNAAMDEFGINTPLRQAAFLAQIAHESGQLRYVREIASGEAYEGRKGLGNTQPGDGVRYRGRGLIQITGRANYAAVGEALGIDCIGAPGILETVGNASRSAAWWWQAHGLNELADAGAFAKITLRINGGMRGQAERLAIYETALQTLGA